MTRRQPLRILLVSTRTYATADRGHLVMKSMLSDLRASVQGDTPAEVQERFQHAIEQAAQDKFGGTWLAIPTADPYGLAVTTDVDLNPAYALLPLDALRAALEVKP